MYLTRQLAGGPLVIEKVNPEVARHEKAGLPFPYHSGPTAMVKPCAGEREGNKNLTNFEKYFLPELGF